MDTPIDEDLNGSVVLPISIGLQHVLKHQTVRFAPDQNAITVDSGVIRRDFDAMQPIADDTEVVSSTVVIRFKRDEDDDSIKIHCESARYEGPYIHLISLKKDDVEKYKERTDAVFHDFEIWDEGDDRDMANAIEDILWTIHEGQIDMIMKLSSFDMHPRSDQFEGDTSLMYSSTIRHPAIFNGKPIELLFVRQDVKDLANVKPKAEVLPRMIGENPKLLGLKLKDISIGCAYESDFGLLDVEALSKKKGKARELFMIEIGIMYGKCAPIFLFHKDKNALIKAFGSIPMLDQCCVGIVGDASEAFVIGTGMVEDPFLCGAVMNGAKPIPDEESKQSAEKA